ncbi:hypothetical protein [Streptomyces lancefieldiae]|uniref:Transposase n=1 Tax=Streptomyces lancefieldiae TaxID=3075520 RepID=A0ABU3AG13_9ACTN|nr:hypothetical protein [Streptomyces sp. DSM 40712]MDT0609117.1 hypothetical protein [Streptomyces sp. DSM 40712]
MPRQGGVEGFTRNTFIAMVASVRDKALAAALTTTADWEQGIADLLRTAHHEPSTTRSSKPSP